MCCFPEEMSVLTWDQTFPAGSFGDKRLRERAMEIGKACVDRPGVAMTGAFNEWKDTRNAYNFFENPRASMKTIITTATDALGEAIRMQSNGTTILNVQDTTEIDLSHLRKMSGLGTIRTPIARGLFAHVGLGVSTEGIPIGLLDAQTWVRPEVERGKAQTRRNKAFEDKESLRWWTTIEHAEQRVAKPGLLVHVGDRESDIYELMIRCKENGYRLLVRSAHDRKVQGEHGYLWAQVDTFKTSSDSRLIEVSAQPAKNGKRAQPARQAAISIQFGPVTICAPHRAGGSLSLWAICVREVNPPSEAEPIEWMLLTLDIIQTPADAWERVDWYRHRWSIEEFFKVLKTGCRIESRQFASRETFESSLSMCLLASVQLLGLTKQARVEPSKPATEVLSEDEHKVLHTYARAHYGRDSSVLKLADAVMLIATLGGYKARSCDGPPGWITLWRGYERLRAMVEGFRLVQVHDYAMMLDQANPRERYWEG